MQTSLKDQIEAVQHARKLLSGSIPKDLTAKLNDAASTIASVNLTKDLPDNKLREAYAKLAEASKVALSYFADLNGAEWIPSDSVGGLEMRQRSRHIQEHLYKLLNP